jgi:pilus assembly protein CpaB
MTRMRILIVLVIAVLAGGGLAAGTYRYLQNMPVKEVNAPTKPVVVANADLALGTELHRDDLTVMQWPAAGVPEGAFGDVQSLVGRGLIVSVVRHEPILPGKLASKEAGAGLPPIIPPGKRALSVKVNEVIGVAGYVLPGTRVDVVATASPTNKQEDTTTKVVLSNVEVLTAGTRIEQKGDDAKPVQVTVVTLLVTPEESERLSLASTEGKIQLALRNPLDGESPFTPGIRTSALVGTAAPKATVTMRRPSTPAAAPSAVPAPPPPAPTIEIIRGDKRSQVSVG